MTRLSLRTEQLDKIRQLAKVGEDHTYKFLGYTLDLETGQFHDLLEKGTVHSDWGVQSMTALLVHYSFANETPKSGKLVKFKGKILQFALHLQLEGYSSSTIYGWAQKLRQMANNSNVDNPDSVKKYLALSKMSEASKYYFCTAYTAFLKWQNRTWTIPKYKNGQKIPEFIPTEAEIDALISGCGPKTAVLLQTLKESGMRIGEACSLTWQSLNPEANTITLNTPEKNSLPRIFKVSPRLVAMLQRLPKSADRIFIVSARHAGINYLPQRKKLSKKLGNPRLAKIHFHLIRHWKGTMEYHKTQNIIQVQRMLGHKSILNTQLYVNLEQAVFEFNDDYEVKIAGTLDEACKLLEVGFEYVTEMDGKKLFRKRK